MLFFRLGIPAIALFLSPGLSLFAQDSSSLTPDQILKELQVIQKQHDDQLSHGLTQIITDISTAAATPDAARDFYAQAIHATQFEGKDREAVEFHDWEKRNDSLYDAKTFGPMVQAHLKYLVISLRRAAGEEIKNLVPDLIGYLQDTQAILDSTPNRPEIGDFRALAINASPFSKWYGLDHAFDKIDAWELQFDNLDSIADKTLMPYFRQQKDPRVIDLWNFRIDRESKRAEGSDLALTKSNFDNIRKPELMWKRAKDMIVIGQRAQGINDMYQLIKTYPGHPSFDTWAQELTAVLQPPPAVPAKTQP